MKSHGVGEDTWTVQPQSSEAARSSSQFGLAFLNDLPFVQGDLSLLLHLVSVSLTQNE